MSEPYPAGVLRVDDEPIKMVKLCSKCVTDPCVFIFRKGNEVSIALIYTDDVDMIGSSSDMMREIYDALNSEWGCKIVDDKFFLGVRRDTVGDADSPEMTVELTMNAYAEGMHGAFESWLPSSHVVTPFPEHICLSRSPFTKVKFPYKSHKSSYYNHDSSNVSASQIQVMEAVEQIQSETDELQRSLNIGMHEMHASSMYASDASACDISCDVSVDKHPMGDPDGDAPRVPYSFQRDPDGDDPDGALYSFQK